MSSSSCVASDAPSSRLSPKISYCIDRLLLQRSSKGRENVTALGAFLSRAHAALVRVAHGRIKRRTINRLSHTERRHKPSPTDTKHCPLAQGKLALIRGPRNESIPFDNGSRPRLVRRILRESGGTPRRTRVVERVQRVLQAT